MAGTHGGRYRKDKTSAHRHDTFTATKLLFDTAELPFDSRGGTVAVMLCGSAQYRVPEVLVKIARHNGPTIDRERMGIRFDENEPIVPGVTPVHPDGIPYSGPAAIVPWWGASNHTAWQLIPLTLDTMQQYSLWDGELFQDYAVLRPFATTGSYALVQGLASGPRRDQHGVALQRMLCSAPPTTSRCLPRAIARACARVRDTRTAVLPGDAPVFITHPGSQAKLTTD